MGGGVGVSAEHSDRSRTADVVAVCVTMSATGLAFDRAFALPALAPVVVSAVAVPVVALLVADRWRHRRDRRVAPTVLRGLVVALSSVLLFQMVRGGLVDLLSVTLPAPPRWQLLAVPAAFTFLAAATGTAVALRVGRDAALVAVLPAAPAWMFCVLLGPPTTVDRFLVAAVAVVAAGQLLHSAPGRRRAVAARSVVLLAAAAAVAAAAVPVALVVGSRTPVDVRSAVPAVPLYPATVNPVDRVDGWLMSPDTLLFRATTDGPAPYWRLAVLPTFDGERWLPPARYTTAGLGVPADPTVRGASARAVRQSVTVVGLRGPFLPTAGRPERIGPPVTAVDTDSGILVADRAVRPGLTYTVTAQDRDPPGDAACPPRPQSRPPSRPDPALAYPPDLAQQLRDLAGACTGTFTSFAAALEQRLNKGRTNLAARPAAGASVGALRRFLLPGGSGTIVEFASSFALAVRTAGVPSRLVVGFAPPARAAGAEIRVTAADVRVWVDVHLPRTGWTAYHPVPPSAEHRDRTETDGAAPPPPPSVSPSPSPVPSGADSPQPEDGAGGLDPAGLLRRLGLVVGLVLALLLAAYVGAVLTVPVIRRRLRRGRGSVREKGIGAWHDVLDELAYRPARLATGVDLHAGTPASTMRLVATRFEGTRTRADHLARTAEACLYGRHAPRPSDVELAWRAATDLRRRIRRSTGWRLRARHRFSWRNVRQGVTW